MAAGVSLAHSSFLISSAHAAKIGATTRVEKAGIPDELQGVGVSEHLGETVDVNGLTFRSPDDGKEHKLADFMEPGKPTLVNLVYYECPMLCTMVLNGVSDGMKGLDWTVGKEFNVVTVSIDPRDDLDSARAKKETYVQHYLEEKGSKTPSQAEIAQVSKGWQFLIGEEATVKKFASQLGFNYNYDKIQKQYAHPAVTFILTPEGKISRYLYGIQYRPRDLRLALLEASRGKIGNVFDRLLMFCYHYEPTSRGYTLQAVRVMQAGGAGTLVLLGGYLTLFWTRQRKGKKK